MLSVSMSLVCPTFLQIKISAYKNDHIIIISEVCSIYTRNQPVYENLLSSEKNKIIFANFLF